MRGCVRDGVRVIDRLDADRRAQDTESLKCRMAYRPRCDKTVFSASCGRHGETNGHAPRTFLRPHGAWP